MSTKYTAPVALVGYGDSVNATGRIGPSAFSLLVDFSKMGAATATGLVVTDILDGIGTLPQNCVIRTIGAQVVNPITTLAGDAPAAIPLTLKAGSITLDAMTLADVNGPALGTEMTAVSLSNGTIRVDGTKADLSIVVGAVLDADSVATAITGGRLMLVFYVDYMPEVEELEALYDNIDEVSDGGNAAPASSMDPQIYTS
jgi:hypothetical protein